VLNSNSRVLKNPIQMGESIGHKLVVAPHFLHHLKEPSYRSLCLFLVLVQSLNTLTDGSSKIILWS
jgi:hypothetical protein